MPPLHAVLRWFSGSRFHHHYHCLATSPALFSTTAISSSEVKYLPQDRCGLDEKGMEDIISDVNSLEPLNPVARDSGLSKFKVEAARDSKVTCKGDVGQDEEEEMPDVPEEDQKSLRIAIIGAPNSGKSTLVNQLLGQKVLAVSPRPHTTTRRALGVFTQGNTQIELLDTPGLIPISYARSLRKSRQFTADPGRSLLEADLVAVMVDASNKMKREQLDLSVLRLVEKFPLIPSILLLNKVDLLKKKTVLLKLVEHLTGSEDSDRHRMGYLVRRWKDERVPISQKKEIKEELDKLRRELAARKQLKEDRLKVLKQAQQDRDEGLAADELGGEKKEGKMGKKLTVVAKDLPPLARSCWPYFKEVFMISAIDRDGVPKLMDYLLSCAKPRKWEYSVSEVTDQPALSLVEDIIREKICLHTEKEIPYLTTQENVIWERDESGGLVIYQNLHCGKRSRAAILIGKEGSMVNTIRDEAAADIEELFGCSVNLTLHVKK